MITGQMIGSAMIGASIFVAYAGTRWDGCATRWKSCPAIALSMTGWVLACLVSVVLLLGYGFRMVSEGMDQVFRISLHAGIWVVIAYAAHLGATAPGRQVPDLDQSP